MIALAQVSGIPLEVDREVSEDGSPQNVRAENSTAHSTGENGEMAAIPERAVVTNVANANAAADPANDMAARNERRIKFIMRTCSMGSWCRMSFRGMVQCTQSWRMPFAD